MKTGEEFSKSETWDFNEGRLGARLGSSFPRRLTTSAICCRRARTQWFLKIPAMRSHQDPRVTSSDKEPTSPEATSHNQQRTFRSTSTPQQTQGHPFWQ